MSRLIYFRSLFNNVKQRYNSIDRDDYIVNSLTYGGILGSIVSPIYFNYSWRDVKITGTERMVGSISTSFFGCAFGALSGGLVACAWPVLIPGGIIGGISYLIAGNSDEKTTNDKYSRLYMTGSGYDEFHGTK